MANIGQISHTITVSRIRRLTSHSLKIRDSADTQADFKVYSILDLSGTVNTPAHRIDMTHMFASIVQRGRRMEDSVLSKVEDLRKNRINPLSVTLRHSEGAQYMTHLGNVQGYLG